MNTKLAVCLFCGAALLLGVGCATPAAATAPEASEAILVAIETVVTGRVEATLEAQQTPAATATATAPPAAEPTTATPCRLWLSATQDTPLREGPGDDNAETGRMLAGQSSEVIGRDVFYRWWVVVVDGRAGWVNGRAVALSDCANYPPVLAPPPSARAAPAALGS